MRAVRYRNPDLLRRLAQLGCVICLRSAEIHHSRAGLGLGQRAGDHRAYPLCPQHHRLGPEAIHQIGREAWEDRHGHETVHIAWCHKTLGFEIPEGTWR